MDEEPSSLPPLASPGTRGICSFSYNAVDGDVCLMQLRLPLRFCASPTASSQKPKSLYGP